MPLFTLLALCCAEKPMRVPQQQYKHGLNDYLSCTGIGLFFKALPEKGLMQKGKKTTGGKKSKQCMTIIFLVASDGSLFLNKLLSGDYKNHALLSHLKIH